MMPLIILPPGPITSLIFSGLILIVYILGAYGDRSSLGALNVSDIIKRIFSMPCCPCITAFDIVSFEMPFIFISIWIAVMPFFEPAILKSISPRWSSSPKMSDRIISLSPSFTRPIAIPATDSLIGTPASISDRQLLQTVAIDDEPLDSSISETIRIVYGKSSLAGRAGKSALSARLP
ncbi:MAG: hypothetical protein BWX58_01598 [Deltaproteobacteria bacterium ADurb.Bin026]|nr:MAG: hypothetical protein BWX58_01598 [Deltaproteobacteria bacterium ADurb.Bin026]